MFAAHPNTNPTLKSNPSPPPSSLSLQCEVVAALAGDSAAFCAKMEMTANLSSGAAPPAAAQVHQTRLGGREKLHAFLANFLPFSLRAGVGLPETLIIPRTYFLGAVFSFLHLAEALNHMLDVENGHVGCGFAVRSIYAYVAFTEKSPMLHDSALLYAGRGFSLFAVVFSAVVYFTTFSSSNYHITDGAYSDTIYFSLNENVGAALLDKVFGSMCLEEDFVQNAFEMDVPEVRVFLYDTVCLQIACCVWHVVMLRGFFYLRQLGVVRFAKLALDFVDCFHRFGSFDEVKLMLKSCPADIMLAMYVGSFFLVCFSGLEPLVVAVLIFCLIDTPGESVELNVDLSSDTKKGPPVPESHYASLAFRNSLLRDQPNPAVRYGRIVRGFVQKGAEWCVLRVLRPVKMVQEFDDTAMLVVIHRGLQHLHDEVFLLGDVIEEIGVREAHGEAMTRPVTWMTSAKALRLLRRTRQMGARDATDATLFSPCIPFLRLARYTAYRSLHSQLARLDTSPKVNVLQPPLAETTFGTSGEHFDRASFLKSALCRFLYCDEGDRLESLELLEALTHDLRVWVNILHAILATLDLPGVAGLAGVQPALLKGGWRRRRLVHGDSVILTNELQWRKPDEVDAAQRSMVDTWQNQRWVAAFLDPVYTTPLFLLQLYIRKGWRQACSNTAPLQTKVFLRFVRDETLIAKLSALNVTKENNGGRNFTAPQASRSQTQGATSLASLMSEDEMYFVRSCGAKAVHLLHQMVLGYKHPQFGLPRCVVLEVLNQNLFVFALRFLKRNVPFSFHPTMSFVATVLGQEARLSAESHEELLELHLGARAEHNRTQPGEASMSPEVLKSSPFFQMIELFAVGMEATVQDPNGFLFLHTLFSSFEALVRLDAVHRIHTLLPKTPASFILKLAVVSFVTASRGHPTTTPTQNAPNEEVQKQVKRGLSLINTLSTNHHECLAALKAHPEVLSRLFGTLMDWDGVQSDVMTLMTRLGESDNVDPGGSETAMDGVLTVKGVAGDTCCVCLLDIEPDETVTRLHPCGHNFHTKCVRVWLYTQSKCPTCRSAVGSAAVRREQHEKQRSLTFEEEKSARQATELEEESAWCALLSTRSEERTDDVRSLEEENSVREVLEAEEQAAWRTLTSTLGCRLAAGAAAIRREENTKQRTHILEEEHSVRQIIEAEEESNRSAFTSHAIHSRSTFPVNPAE